MQMPSMLRIIFVGFLVIDMLPCFPINHGFYRISRQLVLLGKSAVMRNSWFIKFPYSSDNGWSKFCFRMIDSLRRSSFLNSICYIVFECSKKEMLRIDTKRMVAFMTNQKSFWNRPIMDFISYSMRSQSRASSFSFHDYSISISFCGSNPIPTTIGFFNVFPKPLFNWDYGMAVGSDRHLAIV